MTKRQVPELVKYVIDNSNAPNMAASLKDWQSDMETLCRTVESSTQALDYFQTKLKSITTDRNSPDFGLGVQELIVQKSSSGTAGEALQSKITQLDTIRQWAYNIRQLDVPVKTGTMSLTGEDAFKEARAQLKARGGDIWRDPTAKSPDRVRYFYPYDNLNTATSQEKAQVTREIFGEANKLSKAEKEYNDWEKSDKEARQQHKEEKKKTLESAHKTTAVAKGILSIVIVATDILRRLLTATLQNATKVDRQAVEARSVGVSYGQRRDMDIFDKAHGLPEGATFGAISAIQNMFGDITRLDEGALGILARVMGNDVESLVKSGIGGDTPDVLLGKILDSYFKQFMAGKNSLGQTVGQEQARRELITSLRAVSPEIATLFARMIDDKMSGKYGDDIQNYESWRATTKTNRTSLTEADMQYAQEMGTKYNEVLAIVEDLKTSFLVRLAGSMDDLLTKIKNIRAGMNSTESLELDRENRRKNEATIEVIKKSADLYSANAQEGIDKLNASLPNKSGRTFNYTAETLAGIAKGTINLKTLKKSGIEGSGMISSADAKAYLERGKILLATAMLDTNVSDEIVRIWAGLDALEDIEKENAKTQKVGEVDFSYSEETVKAQKKYKDLVANLQQAYKDGTVFSTVAVDKVKEAYANELRDNPYLYEAVLYELFGTDTVSSEALAIANKNATIADTGVIPGRKGSYTRKSVQQEMNKRYEAKKKKYMKDNKKSSLTPEEEKELYIDFITEVNAQPYIGSHHNIHDNKDTSILYLKSVTEDASIQALQQSDSSVLSQLLRAGIAYGTYQFTRTKDSSGVYKLIIEGKDSKGKNATITVPLGTTEGAEEVGTMVYSDQGLTYQQAK